MCDWVNFHTALLCRIQFNLNTARVVTSLQMVGVVQVGAAQLDLFIIALSKAVTAVICFLVLLSIISTVLYKLPRC